MQMNLFTSGFETSSQHTLLSFHQLSFHPQSPSPPPVLTRTREGGTSQDPGAKGPGEGVLWVQAPSQAELYGVRRRWIHGYSKQMPMKPQPKPADWNVPCDF